MAKKKTVTERDLENLVKGFDAPAKEDHLEQLREQARERDQGQEQAHKQDPTGLRGLFKEKENEAKRELDRDREHTRGRGR